MTMTRTHESNGRAPHDAAAATGATSVDERVVRSLEAIVAELRLIRGHLEAKGATTPAAPGTGPWFRHPDDR